jgi:hypothetical protein
MRVKHDPNAPIYVLIDADGNTETFQFPYRLIYKDRNGQETEATLNDTEELILFMDRSEVHNLQVTLVEIDARMGDSERILPRL